MAAKKRNESRSTAKSAKNVRGRSNKTKISRRAGKKQSARKRVTLKPNARRDKKAAAASAEQELQREFQSQNRAQGTRGLARRSEDFEGVSRAEQADSESVDELVEEGNLFEAGAVAGVQEADDADENEVHTHEFSEDDVPEEYDKD